MLSQMRTFTRGWVAYLLLFVLVIAFAIWGVNDVFSGVSSQSLAQVKGREITPAMLTRELELTLRAERSNGANLSQQEAIDAGMHRRLLDGLIGRQSLYAYQEHINVSAGDTLVAQRIREIPATQNPVTGTFDQTAYQRFLQQMRYAQGEFESDIRGDMTTQMMMEAMVRGVRAPSSYGALALAYESETRTISVAEAPASAAGAIPQPTETQLQAFWEDSQEQLRLPEFRGVTMVYARAADFVARANVSDARLREEFEARRAALSQPERRTYVRLSAQNQAQANDAAARLQRGESADAVAQALGLQATRGENQARGDVPDAAVAAAVFEGQRGATRVIQARLSPWAVVRVDAITPGREPDFAAMRDELRQAIAQDEAAELLNTAVSTFEDARAEGVSLADAARRAGLPTTSIAAVEAGGRNQEGQPVEALAEQQDLLGTIFATPEGEATDFVPLGDADVMVSVDRIIPSRVRPLDEVRGDLTEVWVARERVNRLRELGEQAIAAVRGGQSFAAAARANRFAVRVTSQPINRRTAAEALPARGLAGQIFAAQPGTVVTDLRPDGGAVYIAQIEAVNRVDPATQPQAVEEFRGQLQNSIGTSLGEATQSAIIDWADARRNEALLNRLFRTSDQQDEGAQ